MKRFGFLSVIGLLAVISTAATIKLSLTPAQASNDKYRECVSLTGKNPQAAIALSNTWKSEDATPMAQHCHALALYALKDYTQSANELIALSREFTSTDMKVTLLMQAARALDISGNPSGSMAALGEAFTAATAANDNASILTVLRERIRHDIATSQFYSAMQNIDHALAISDNAPEFVAMQEQVNQTLNAGDTAYIHVGSKQTVAENN